MRARMSETAGKPMRGGAGTLAAMGACYALGTFTDNFYKQAAILIAAGSQMTGMQSIATVLFSLPFILFSAWAGAFADRLPKKTVIVGVKSLEFAALLVGGYMLMTENWGGILAVMFCMGTQSAFFSPAINGSIPENFPPPLVPKANALIKLVSTAAILGGMAAAGAVLDLRGGQNVLFLPGLDAYDFGRVMAAFCLALVAFAGLVAALLLKFRQAAGRQGRAQAFPWAGPVASVKQAWGLRKDRELMYVLLADAWFFGIAAIAVISIANLSAELGYSLSTAGGMTALLMAGVAAGALVAGRFQADNWRSLLIPSACGMAGMLCLAGITPFIPREAGTLDPQLVWFGASLLCTGFCGGMYLIPLESFIQIRPRADQKGEVIAVSNFLSFMAMALFGAVFKLIAMMPPAWTFFFYGGATFCFVAFFAWATRKRLKPVCLRDSAGSFLGFCLRGLLALRYTVTEQGLEAIAPAVKRRIDGGPGLLVLPNHPALIDPVVVYSRLAGIAPRPLADERQMSGPLQRIAGRIVGAVTIPDSAGAGRKDMARVLDGIRAVTEALKQGYNVLLYPSGRVYRSDKEHIGNNAGVFRILKEVPEARVLLVRTSGLWGSSFSYAAGNVPNLSHGLKRAVVVFLGNLFFWVPKRRVHLEFVETIELTRLVLCGEKRAVNQFLETFYNKKAESPCFVPLFFWQRETREIC